jgi:hypothetical protein
MVQYTGKPYDLDKTTHRYAMFTAIVANFATAGMAVKIYGNRYIGAAKPNSPGVKFGDTELGYFITNGWLKIIK